MFLGLFIVLAGVMSLLETFGVIQGDYKWGLPLAVICIGLSFLYEAYKASKKNN